MTEKSNLKKWDYSHVSEICYGDFNQESYKKSAEFLGEECEDWGCGTGWSKRYFKKYEGIDGSPSKEVKEEDIVDLVNYTSSVDNILMRQVLEANLEWRKILENVKKSFKKKFCLVIMTPMSSKTEVLEIEPVRNYKDEIQDGENIYMITFKKEDILEFFPKEEFLVKEESIFTKQGYNQEWILYVERIN